MARLDDLTAAEEARRRERDGARAETEDLAARIRELPRNDPQVPRLVAQLRTAQVRLAAAEDALARAAAELDALLAGPESAAGLVADTPVLLLPVRLETRFVEDAAGPALLVRVYPDEIHVDDHEPELIAAELGAAALYWERVWRAGRSDPGAERAAFVELGARVGVTRALWVARATEPADDAARPDDPVPEGSPLPAPPVLADAPTAESAFNRPAQARVLPDRWVALGFRGGRRVLRAVGGPIADPLQLGPSPDPGARPDGEGPPLEDGLHWLADFDAAVAVGMGIRVPLEAPSALDRLLVVGLRGEDPEASAARLRELLDGQRYTSGVGFVATGAPTNNTDADRSAWSRRPSAEEAFDAARETAPAAAANAPATAAALGLPADALTGVPGAARREGAAARDLHRALWPATVGYFLETLVAPVADDATVDAVAELFVESVRGLGPLPALRVGGQPYGLLPATALGRWRPAPDDDAEHGRLVRLLRVLAPEWLAATAPGAARAVPHVGRAAAGEADQELLDILSRDALSGGYRLRPVRGALTARAVAPLVSGLDGAGAALAGAAHRLLGGGATAARVAEFEFEPRAARIRRAPVLEGPLSETDPIPAEPRTGRNYLAFLGGRKERTAAFDGPGGRSILFALARQACRLADADAAVRATRPASVVAAKAELEPDVIDAVPGRPSRTASRLLDRPAREIISPQAAAGASVGDFLATATAAEVAAIGRPHITDAYRRALTVRLAVGRLAGLPSAALDRLTRALIDVCSHRLDAWITAYSTRRLGDARGRRPSGVQLGGYGWVEDLRPKPAPEPVTELPQGEAGPLVTDPANAGYVAAPSLTQAATAALLLSGHLTHRGGAGPGGGAFAVDLSSDRARLARWLLDGVRLGQPLGALLGYRLERGLHDASRPGLELDRFIRPLRALAPLVAGRREEVAPTVEAVEAVAPTNVVDGLALLARFEDDPTSLDPALAGAGPAERSAVLGQVASLADAADALADLMTAETTYQLAAGNVARAAASLDALGSGTAPPPEPEVLSTPRAGLAATHRLLALVPTEAGPPPGWEAGAERPRRLAEPGLDRCVADLLGTAGRIRAALRVVAPGASAVHVEVDLDEDGACALDLVYESGGAPDTAFERALADRVAARPGVPDGARVEPIRREHPDWPGHSWQRDVVPLEDALEQARWLGEVMGSARPLTAADLTGAGASVPPGVVEDELAARAAGVEARFRAASAELAGAVAGADDARLRDALRELAGFGLAGAADGATAAPPDLAAVAGAAAAEAGRIVALLDAGGLAPADALQAIFGPSFAVVPVVEAPPEWPNALAAAAPDAFLDGDPAAPVAWLQRAARGREPVDRYLLAVAGAARGRLTVAQIPAGERWIGLPDDGAGRPAGTTSILAHGSAGVARQARLAGLVVDEWTDVVPGPGATAGVAFHFDEPGSRAPQALLLAVPPVLGEPWSLDALADVVSETADLARIRMVGPDEAPWLGRYLPALYVPDNPSGDTLGLDVAHLVARDAEEGP